MEVARPPGPVVATRASTDRDSGNKPEAGQKRKRPWNVVRQGAAAAVVACYVHFSVMWFGLCHLCYVCASNYSIIIRIPYMSVLTEPSV